MKTKVLTYNGPITVEFSVGDRVRVNPDTRGTFLPVLRDEVCEATEIANHGTKRAPDWRVKCRAIDARNGVHAERWIGVADLEVIS